MHSVPHVLHAGVGYLGKTLRIAWNVLTLSETAYRYPARARELVRHWLFVRHRNSRLARSCGRLVYERKRARQARQPDAEHTYFLRNHVQFEMLRDITLGWSAATLRVASIGCSTGAELYSALWTIRRARPELHVVGTGADISTGALESARSRRYARAGREVQRLGAGQIEDLIHGGLFEPRRGTLVVQPWVAEGARWLEADVLDPSLPDRLGDQDIVFANNILCHFSDSDAEAALTNIARLLAPGGYLFMYCVDLDVKSRAVRALGLAPVLDRLEELYEGDEYALRRWPVMYWAPEPIDRTRPEWTTRYATLFRNAAHPWHGTERRGRPPPARQR